MHVYLRSFILWMKLIFYADILENYDKILEVRFNSSQPNYQLSSKITVHQVN